MWQKKRKPESEKMLWCWLWRGRKRSQRIQAASAAAAKSLLSCLTLCDPRDGSPPGSPVPGILQARTLEWVVLSFSNAWQWKLKGKLLSCVWLLATRWPAAYQASPSMGFARQEYWSGVPSPSPQVATRSSKKQGSVFLYSLLQKWGLSTPLAWWNLASRTVRK